MNSTDRARVKRVKDMANQLMDSKPSVNPVVKNVDIIEALIGDLGAIEYGNTPHNMAALIKRADEAGEL